MRAVEYITIGCYVISLLAASYILIAHRRYFKERFSAGVVNVFMLSMLVFLMSYTVKMVLALFIRTTRVLHVNDSLLEAMQEHLWAISMLGTTFGLVVLAFLTFRKHFDVWIQVKRIDQHLKKKEESDEIHTRGSTAEVRASTEDHKK